jgi:hypothetical protein
MKTWHAFADPKAPPRIGIGANDPPVTGGVVFDTFEHDGGTHADRLRIAEERSSPLRVERLERGSWQPYGEKFPANGSGYDEALMFMQAITSVGGEVRLVTRNGTVLPPTSGTRSTFAPPPLGRMPMTSFPHSVPGPQRHPHLYESEVFEPPPTGPGGGATGVTGAARVHQAHMPPSYYEPAGVSQSMPVGPQQNAPPPVPSPVPNGPPHLRLVPAPRGEPAAPSPPASELRTPTLRIDPSAGFLCPDCGEVWRPDEATFWLSGPNTVSFAGLARCPACGDGDGDGAA